MSDYEKKDEKEFDYVMDAIKFLGERDFEQMVKDFLYIHEMCDLRCKNNDNPWNFLFDLVYFISKISDKYLDDLIVYRNRFPKLWEKIEKAVDRKFMDKLSQSVDELYPSVRLSNFLSQNNIETLAELVCLTEERILKLGSGKKTLSQIKENLQKIGLSIGMDLTKFGITSENVKEKIKFYLNEKRESPYE